MASVIDGVLVFSILLALLNWSQANYRAVKREPGEASGLLHII
jgi:hypothetical protein